MRYQILKTASVFGLAATMTPDAFAENQSKKGFYGSVWIGYSALDEQKQVGTFNPFANVEHDSDVSYSVGVGYKFKNNLRLEAAVTQRSGSSGQATTQSITNLSPNLVEGTTQGEFESLAYTLNGYIDTRADKRLRPYAKWSVGLAQNTSSATLNVPTQNLVRQYEERKNVSATYGVGVGVSYDLRPRITAFAEAQVSNLGEAYTHKDSQDALYRSDGYVTTDFAIGLRFRR